MTRSEVAMAVTSLAALIVISCILLLDTYKRTASWHDYAADSCLVTLPDSSLTWLLPKGSILRIPKVSDPPVEIPNQKGKKEGL